MTTALWNLNFITFCLLEVNHSGPGSSSLTVQTPPQSLDWSY